PGELVAEHRGVVTAARDAIVIGEVIPVRLLETLKAAQVAVARQTLLPHDLVVLPSIQLRELRRRWLDEIRNEQSAPRLQPLGHIYKGRALARAIQVMHTER